MKIIKTVKKASMPLGILHSDAGQPKERTSKKPMDLPNSFNNVLRLYTHLTVHQSYTAEPVVYLVKKR